MAGAYGPAIMAQLAAVAAVALLVSGACTALALRYARRHGLVDLPGRRRSHDLPTPRGGGVGIVVALLLVAMPGWYALDPARHAWVVVLVAAALCGVAAVGWRDDHAPLAVAPRLAVHLGGALLVGIVALAPWGGQHAAAWWLLPPLAIVLVGFINAHNFMDGIDGILGQQGLFVLLGYAWLAAWVGQLGLAAFALAGAAGCLGFLLFNWPPARIFMGDAGSGTLGLAIGTLAALLVQRNPVMLWACLILPSAFLVDSGLTLLRRVLGRERWYTAHRQHLYQWLVRLGWSHGRTDAAYMGWNLVVVAPLAAIAARWPRTGAVCFVVAWGLAMLAWFVGKRACLAGIRRRGVHEAA